ncbi:MAG: hypothetical protein A3H72_01445 [Candidatus Doudnabacteria bacterium RIFCSPLOWO2_02_FULL_48_8]|uniref:Uncharacterized protein n=1 Tax=Candidatus Doudnabacteria bacterium RIFCSPHIGHO2_01_FULL_46_24 TaxID=1817825 RepID=A0A1F5NTU6_9BACT|nr:MAG: hypothetical protein A2720_00965 [Candidatus Doudnabacteria bacterium RIFCSPHIGHO2_01_FULL_46_24]OGE95414.1 MAG: hypothetical protein A3H72_01445 [Candidatus Doudnabacteria bacterium RIFCSPLOWO2_02_FULL_48_8]OGE95464.1 MAG: hypothetical protein A3E98_01050 [Candidatus Doudnabacteria bacterium RIFCSPHIGHO2_12_FULL_48_11]
METERNVIKKISSEGEDWVNRRESAREDEPEHKRQDIFGANFLHWWNIAHKTGEDWSKMTVGRLADHINKTADQTWKRNFKRLEEEMVAGAKTDPWSFQQFFANYLMDRVPDLGRLSKRLDLSMKQPRANQDLILLAAVFEGERGAKATELGISLTAEYQNGNKILPAKLVASMIDYHSQHVLESERQFMEMIPEYLDKIKTLLLAASNSGEIPIKTDTILERLGALRFAVVDGLTAKLRDFSGDFKDHTHTIRISSEARPEHVGMIMSHEIIHALAGQLEYSSVSKVFEDNPELFVLVERHELLKGGLHFSKDVGEKQSDLPSLRLRWLNEALTEQAAIDLVKGTEYVGFDTYELERKLLDKLVALGISKSLLYEAYFENYAADSTGGHRLPKTRELFETVNRLLGRGFLVNLDIYIRSNRDGVKLALQKWEDLGAEFPSFINDFGAGKIKELRDSSELR